MAARKATQIDDCQRTLEVRSASTSVGTMTVHVPDMLMRANRRQYTQCRAYDLRVKVGSIDSSSEQNYEIYTLSNAWWVKRSIEMAKAVWLNSTKEERALLGDRRGKWNDFIITLNAAAAGNYSDLYQYNPATSGDDMTAAEVGTDETLYESQDRGSVAESDQDIGAEQQIGFTLDSTDVSGFLRSYNIFDQYMLTRQHVTPADTRDSPYEDLLSLDHAAMDNLKQDGDNAPFDLDAFPNPFVLADVVSVDQGIAQGGPTFSKVITAPLGIVIIKKFTAGGAESNFDGAEKVLIDVKKGTYKGVHAPAYKAMKLTLASSGSHKMTR